MTGTNLCDIGLRKCSPFKALYSLFCNGRWAVENLNSIANHFASRNSAKNLVVVGRPNEQLENKKSDLYISETHDKDL